MDALEKKVGLFRAVFPELSDFEKEDWEENFLVEFTHDSTSIEGNTLTLIETKMILADKIVPAETTLRELDEVRGHAEAWQFVKDCVKRQVPLSESVIKDIHERVVPVRGVGGIYRNIPVYIRGARHVPPNPRKVWEAMKNFAYRMKNDAFADPMEKAARIHAEFVKIHPFQDGNGRTARLLMNYHLLAHDFPPTSIKLKNRGAYFAALEEYSVGGRLAPFLQLLRRNMERELEAFLSMYSLHIDLPSLAEENPELADAAALYVQRESGQPCTRDGSEGREDKALGEKER